jgi:hypothetical protein
MICDLENQLKRWIDGGICSEDVARQFLTRVKEGRLTRDENPVNHFDVFFAAYDPVMKHIFFGHHKKADIWLFNGGHMDADSLLSIWEPFGWSREGVLSFIESYNNGEAGWFAGVRNEHGILCAAAKAEKLRLGDTTIIESTEWSTHPDFRRHGYATIAAIALNALILNDSDSTGRMSIFAEANMAPETPGFRVAHRAGFTTLADLTSPIPNHVLPQHVSVGGELRNFLLVQLDNEQISKYYSPTVRQQIMEYIR